MPFFCLVATVIVRNKLPELFGCFTKQHLISSRTCANFPVTPKSRRVFARLFVRVTRRTRASRRVPARWKHRPGGHFLNEIECHASANSPRPSRPVFPFTKLLFFFHSGLRPERILSVRQPALASGGNKSRQNAWEKCNRPSIKKIVVLLHALSLRDGLITPSLLLFSPLSFSLLSCLFVQCCRFPGALQIENSEETDQGKYECVASNMEGVRYSSPANLYVRGREKPVPRARPKWIIYYSN